MAGFAAGTPLRRTGTARPRPKAPSRTTLGVPRAPSDRPTAATPAHRTAARGYSREESTPIRRTIRYARARPQSGQTAGRSGSGGSGEPSPTTACLTHRPA